MRKLNRNITIVIVLFFVALSVVLSVTTYQIYTRSMYERYQKQMKSILDYVEVHIDKDDMAQCARTYQETPKYKKFQAFFDELIDHYEDVHYLYIMQILEKGEHGRVVEICAANSTYEKENEPEMVLHLGDTEEGWYDSATEEKLYRFQEGGKDVYFENPSEWGIDYTLARPLVDSDGDCYAILCVDVDINEINHTVYRNIYINIAVIFGTGLVFFLLLLLWMRFKVTDPLLSRAEAAEDQSKGLQSQVFRDALTSVGNRAAYDEKKSALSFEIQERTAEFGILVADMDGLKKINDKYGHEHGNEYIVGGSEFLCQVFQHSPVFRVGGDEFVVVLQGVDYQNLERLCEELKTRFDRTALDKARDPWRRFSASVGVAVYAPGDEVDDVFNRADQEMYQEKKEKKRRAGEG